MKLFKDNFIISSFEATVPNREFPDP